MPPSIIKEPGKIAHLAVNRRNVTEFDFPDFILGEAEGGSKLET